MKAAICSLLFFCVMAPCIAADAPKQVTKSSKKKQLDAEAEVKAFYLQLTTADAEIKKQIEALTAKTQEDAGGLYHVFDPHVVEWFPSESSWDVGTGLSNSTGRYLVIQPIGYGRGKHAGNDMALVAEFEVESETVSTKIDPKHEERAAHFLSCTLTITFLGFRDPTLTPAAKPK
jgi:hypothetical protein